MVHLTCSEMEKAGLALAIALRVHVQGQTLTESIKPCMLLFLLPFILVSKSQTGTGRGTSSQLLHIKLHSPFLNLHTLVWTV